MICRCGGTILRVRKNSDGDVLCRKCNHNRRNRLYSKTEKGKANSKALMRVHNLEDYRLDNKCGNCGITNDLTLDHKYPSIKGGTNEDRNLWTLCRSCNSFKRDRLLTTGSAPAIMVS